MAAEFKIARLRYNWAGQWVTGEFYNRDAVVQYNGKTYICLIPHNASDFYNDLAHVTPSGAITPYWELSVDGKTWKQEWTSNTYYSLGNIVTYGGVVYVCSESHTSSNNPQPQIDLSKWVTLSTFTKWDNAWTPNTVYGKGDTVKYGGIVYECNTNHISAVDVATGLESDQSKWSLVNNGIEYKGTWMSNVRYKLNDIVYRSPDLYICTAGHTSGTYDSSITFDPTKWQIWMPGLELQTTWSQFAIYNPGDVVIYGGYTYVCTEENYQNNIPSMSSLSWSILTQGFNMKAEWDGMQSYKIGDVVRKGGILFEAAQDVPATTQQLDTDPTSYVVSTSVTSATGTTLVVTSTAAIRPGMIITGPGFTIGQRVSQVTDGTTLVMDRGPDGVSTNGDTVTFTGVNYVYWTPLVMGLNYLARWQYSTNSSPIVYSVGDVVYWQNFTYRCIRNHSASTKIDIIMNRPDLDTANMYWVKLVAHAPKNAMNQLGDLETYVSGYTNTAIAIGEKDKVLKASSKLPTWSTINEITNVFYVSTTQGVDDTQHGTSWDKPFATIKYACDKILEGTFFHNARYLAEANRDWIIEEMWQYMLYAKANSLDGFTPSSVFDETKTRRDAGFILEAVLYDLGRGGNGQTVMQTLAYFVDGSKTQFYNAGTEAVMPYIIAAINKIQSLVIQNAITSTPLLPINDYQVLNNIPVDLRVPQITDAANHPLETGAIDAINALFALPISAFTSHSTTGLPPANQGITSTIFVKTGTYKETLPITVPEMTAIVGDELRGTVVQPNIVINTVVKSSSSADNSFTVITTEGLNHGTPVQFSGAIDIGAPTKTIGGTTTGTTFYVNDTNAANVGVPEVNEIEYLNGSLTHPDGHSKILGFALDGYPVYGPYGYSQATNANSATKRMQSGYTLNSPSTRVAPATNVSQYPMGMFNEDWSFTNPQGTDLDLYNGRYCVTPDYPNGTYAYFCTIDANGDPAYPYVLGKKFYGDPNPFISDYYSGGGSAPAGYEIAYTSQKSNFDGRQHSWTITNGGGNIKIKSTGVPYHSFGNPAGANNPNVKDWNLTFKLRAGTNVASLTHPDVGYGPIGFWLNGVAMFSPSAAQGSPNGFTSIPGYTYNASYAAGEALGYSFGEDLAGGHATPDSTYHYHDFSFAEAWTTGLGSTIVGTAITSTKFSLSTFPGGPIFPVQTQTAGNVAIFLFGGDAIKDMFHLRNGTGLRNMTFTGLLGSLSGINANQTQRPTGGSYSSLDPGRGPNDSRSWIYQRSPYTQNCSVFGYGCTGIKIDGDLHNGGNKSIVANDYTTILSGGVGVWCTGHNALTELVSVFAYYSYAGYIAEGGGKIRATNGNTSYGTYGVIAEGYDLAEVPISGNVYNKSSQIQASVQSSLSGNAQLVGLNYKNAGNNYLTSTLNFLDYSNVYNNVAWSTDGNVSIQKNQIAPTGNSEAWTLTGTTGGTDSAYIYQSVAIPAAGKTYSGLSATNLTGSGIGALFDITVTSTGYVVSVNQGGSGYVTGNQMFVPGDQLGGLVTTNDCTITVTSLSGSAILTVSVTGTVPQNSARNYTLSAYVKYGNVPSVDLYGTFSGNTTVRSSVNYNFLTGVTTASSDGTGFVPSQYGVVVLPNGWYRLWMAVNDVTGLNTNLEYRLYARGRNNGAGYTYFYGSQLELSTNTGKPSFYFETDNNNYTSYANFNIQGAGTGALVVGDENRTQSVFQTRITDLSGSGTPGGAGYLTASNNAQGGTDTYVLLAGSDTKSDTNYVGMNVFINSGTGAGQYGTISYFDSGNSKRANVLKPSFKQLNITATTSSTNNFTLGSGSNVSQLYVGMPCEFTPTYYTTSTTNTSTGTVLVTAVSGGIYNLVTVATTAQLRVNQPIKFFASDNTQAMFGGITPDYFYYISSIIDSTTIQITATIYGPVAQLVTATGQMTMSFPAGNSFITVGSTANMLPNLVAQFTGGTALGGLTLGNTYYIQDIIDGYNFTISNSLVTVAPTAVASTGNLITVSSTSTLIPLNPIVFAGTTTGTNIVEGTKYYISKIVSANTFQISSSILSTQATATQITTNLITVGSTAGFQANNPVVFIGNTFGNVQAEVVYYILAVNNATSFTISQTPGGSAVGLINATGNVLVRTSPAAFNPGTNASVSNLTGTSTSTKTNVTTSTGTMNVQFRTSLFGGPVSGTTYYVNTIDSNNNTFTVTASQGSGISFNLATKTGAMKLGASGWDHIIPGTPAISPLDSSTVYFIEPKLEFTDPTFSQTAGTMSILPPTNNWVDVAYGDGDGYWIAIANGGSTASRTSDGLNWSNVPLPTSGNWTGIAYGQGAWVIISSGGATNSTVLVSFNNGNGWRPFTLPSSTTWTSVAYGNGKFVAIASNSTTAAYSTNSGQTWASGSGLPNQAWVKVVYGKGVFVAIAASGTVAAKSTDGINWTSVTLPISATWSDIAYGNNRFLIVSSASSKTIYSFDLTTWYQSNLAITGTSVAYGQGVFLAVNASANQAWTTDDCVQWISRSVSSDAYGNLQWGVNMTTGIGYFVTVAAQTAGSRIIAGVKTKARPTVVSNIITSISLFEPGSGYSSSPTVTITDPNVQTPATLQPRVGNGSLANPTFINKGSGYNTTTTTIAISGNGYADDYQTGLSLIIKNLTKLPRPGDNLSIAGNDKIYKVTNATIMFGTTAPNIEANVQISPDMTVALSPEDNTAILIRQQYSQARLTGHDFLNIGTGDVVATNYPIVDVNETQPQNQTVEVDYGRVFYTSTDQDGNFKVGTLFGVEQATGIITLSASQFGLSGLETLSLGGIAVGGASVVIKQFSTDQTFVANSNNIVPTQKAIKAYLTSRLSQGGSNTFTGQLIAGVVLVGGPNKIASTIPEGTQGSGLKVLNVALFGKNGGYGQWDGDGMALEFYMKGAFFRG